MLNYILWYIKDYNKTSFLYKLKTKGTDEKEQVKPSKKLWLDVDKADVKELLRVDGKHQSSASTWYITDKHCQRQAVNCLNF